MRPLPVALAVAACLVTVPVAGAGVIAVAEFPGGQVTTPAAGFNDVTASLDLTAFGYLYDDGNSMTVGGAPNNGTIYYYFTGQSNATDFTSAPEVDGTEDFAGIQLYAMGTEGLGVGNNWSAWAYSIYNPNADLVRPSDNASQLVRSGEPHLFVVKITYSIFPPNSAVIWMDPDPADGDAQADTAYRAEAEGPFAFDEVRARSGSNNQNNSWTFSNVTFVESWADVPEPATLLLTGVGGALVALRRRRMR